VTVKGVKRKEVDFLLLMNGRFDGKVEKRKWVELLVE
jgi:hypothetical protein